jgi:hypothetical protein
MIHHIHRLLHEADHTFLMMTMTNLVRQLKNLLQFYVLRNRASSEADDQNALPSNQIVSRSRNWVNHASVTTANHQHDTDTAI